MLKASTYSKAEHDIKQRVMAENHQRHYQGYVNELDAIGRNANWHAAQDKYSMGKMQRVQDKIMQAELKQANHELKAIRNSRLKELYANDWKK